MKLAMMKLVYLMMHPARSKQTAPWYATCLHLSNFDIKANDLHRYWLTIPTKKPKDQNKKHAPTSDKIMRYV